MSEDNEIKNESNSKTPKTPNKFTLAAVFVISFAVAYWGVGAILNVNRPKVKKVNAQKMQIAKDASFVKGFELINTTNLKDYCAAAGYVPNDYINDFQKQFSKTISNADKIIAKNFPKKEFQKLIDEKISKEAPMILDNEYKKLSRMNGMSKKEFCQIFDKEKDSLIQDKIRIFKANKPNMYLD